MQSVSDNKILIGRINGLFGVRGWLRFFSYSRPPANLLTYNPLWVKDAQGNWQAYQVEESQAYADGRLVAKFHGVDDREDARLLMGLDVAITPDQLPQSADDYYWVDLMGCTVVNSEGVTLGVVKEMIETGTHDVMRVQAADKSIELIPFVLNVTIQSVDIASKQIVVAWEPGYH